MEFGPSLILYVYIYLLNWTNLNYLQCVTTQKRQRFNGDFKEPEAIPNGLCLEQNMAVYEAQREPTYCHETSQNTNTDTDMLVTEADMEDESPESCTNGIASVETEQTPATLSTSMSAGLPR